MRHLTGAGLLLAASLLLRQALLSRAGLRRRTLRSLAESFFSLARDVHLTLTPLPALLHELGYAEEAEPFFGAVREGFLRGETLPAVWQTAAKDLPLSERERASVAALGSALGGEEESVCAALTHTAQELSDAEQALFARSREDGRVMTALCLGGGTLLGILLL